MDQIRNYSCVLLRTPHLVNRVNGRIDPSLATPPLAFPGVGTSTHHGGIHPGFIAPA